MLGRGGWRAVDGGAEGLRVVDGEVAARGGEEARGPVERVGAEAQERVVAGGFELGERGWEAAGGGGQVACGGGPRSRGPRGRGRGSGETKAIGSKPRGAARPGRRGGRCRTGRRAGCAARRGCGRRRARTSGRCGRRRRRGWSSRKVSTPAGIRVAREDAALAPGRLGDRQQGLAVRRRGLELAGEAQRVLERLDAGRTRSGRTRRTFASASSDSRPRRRAAIRPSATAAASPAREHQRRHAVAGPQPVAAAAAALALDRDAEIAQRDDVAADRADIDAEPRRELGPGRGRPGPGAPRATAARDRSSPLEDRYCPVLPVRSSPWRTNHDRSRSSDARDRPSTTASEPTGRCRARPWQKPSARSPSPASPASRSPTRASPPALALVYWWANENEVHRRAYAAPAAQRCGRPGAARRHRDGLRLGARGDRLRAPRLARGRPDRRRRRRLPRARARAGGRLMSHGLRLPARQLAGPQPPPGRPARPRLRRVGGVRGDLGGRGDARWRRQPRPLPHPWL